LDLKGAFISKNVVFKRDIDGYVDGSTSKTTSSLDNGWNFFHLEN
jgi:hypothetical protein